MVLLLLISLILSPLLEFKGELTHVVIPNEEIQEHVPKLHVQAVVVIENYSITDFKEIWKPIPSNRRLGFRYDTVVHKYNGKNTEIPFHKFCLVNLNDIGYMHQNYDYYIELTTAITRIGQKDVKRERWRRVTL